MKRVILFTLLCVAFVGASEAQFESEDIDFEASGEARTTDDPFRDDEDLGEESEGSGELPVDPDDGGEVTFVDTTESTTTTTTEKKESHTQGKSKSVEVEGESDTGSEETQKIDSGIEEPVAETDPDKGVSDEVKDPDDGSVAVAATPSIQFLAAVIVGGCIGLLFAICVIMLLVYRMRKKDEGSYALDYGLDKKPQGNYEYTKGVDSKEYFA